MDNAPNQRISTSGMKSLDTIFQAVTVELFQHYEIAIAPRPTSLRVPDGFRSTEISAMSGFRSTQLTGWLSLSVPSELFVQMPDGAEFAYRRHDFVRELANQLMGRLKSRMLQFQINLQTTLPTLIARDLLLHKAEGSSSLRWHTFRLLRGDVVASLDGTFDGSELKYVGHEQHGHEGDVILF